MLGLTPALAARWQTCVMEFSWNTFPTSAESVMLPSTMTKLPSAPSAICSRSSTFPLLMDGS